MGITQISNPSLREVVRSNDDGLQATLLEHRIGRSLNDFFVARQYLDGVTPTKANVDDYWTTAFGPLTAPNIVAIYSRRAFAYPFLVVATTLTAPAVGAISWIGLENGAQGYGGYVALIGGGATNWKFGAFAAGQFTPQLDIQSLLGINYTTYAEQYTFKLNKCNAELWTARIRNTPMAVILHGLNEAIPSWEAAPYALGGLVAPMPAQMTTLIEVQGTVSSFGCNMSGANHFVAADGDPLPPRHYTVYTENSTTKWRALATGGVALTSHPIPVWGYQTKTLLFEANAAGTLEVEVYVGGAWRVMATPTVVGNELLQYDLTAEVPIVRLVYTPTNGDTIAAAEWFLS